MSAASHPVPTPAPLPSPLAKALAPATELSPIERRAMVGAIACAHLVGLWALLQVDAVREAVREVAPLMVDMVAPPKPDTPPPPPPPPPPPMPRPPRPISEPPIIAAPQVSTAPAEAFTTPAPPPEPVVITVPTPPSPPAPPAPPAQPPQPKTISASAISYLVPPTGEMPRLSRRARERGTVWLHVVVDAQGLPAQIRLSRSSGFPRLDEHAVEVMRKVRFRPYAENGVPIPIQVITPIEYDPD